MMKTTDTTKKASAWQGTRNGWRLNDDSDSMVQVNPQLTGGIEKYNWFTDWKSA